MSTEPDKKALLAPLADAYEPNEADAERVFARIQASLLASGAAVPPASSALPAAAPAPAPAAPVAAAAAGARAGKGLALLGLSVLVLAIGGAAVLKQTQSDGVRPVATVAEHAVAPPALTSEINPAPREVTTGTTPAIPSISVDSLPSANAVTRGAAATPSAPASANAGPKEAAPPPAADTLEKEARLLAEARRAVQRGEGTQALALLDEHARDYPKGWLANDRAAEHIVVLCSLGRRDEAVREAQVFLEGRPKGPLTRRVTLSCAGEP